MQKVKNCILTIIVLIFFAACNITNRITSEYPDEIVIYMLPQFSRYKTNVNCDELKKMNSVNKLFIRKKNDINKLYLKLKDANNLTIDSSMKYIDARILIEFKCKDKIIEQICWSPNKRLEIDDKIYSYSNEIQNLFLEYKLIILIIQ